MPIEAVVWHSWPLSCSGWLSTDSSSPAMRSTSSRSAASSRMTTNSSPPSRATTSLERSAPRSLARDFHQQHVAGIMAQRIVDDLEPVEIDEQQRELPLIALRGLDRAAQQPVEHLPVGQVRQAVMRGEIFDPLVGPGLFVGAVEILQRKGHVVGEPLQQFGEFGRERVLLGGNEHHDADDLPAHEQRERRRRIVRRRCALWRGTPGCAGRRDNR